MSKRSVELSKLWDEVCIGNQRAYSLLHRHLYPKLYTQVKRIVKDEELADDVLQETFIRLWLKKEVIGKIENVEGYFFAAVRSISINYIRKRESLEAKKDSLTPSDIQDSIEDIITEREANLKQRRVIESALDKLPARQREIMHLRFFESLNCSEIGEITGIQYQSVVNNMYRAVQTLRERYRSEGELRVA